MVKILPIYLLSIYQRGPRDNIVNPTAKTILDLGHLSSANLKSFSIQPNYPFHIGI